MYGEKRTSDGRTGTPKFVAAYEKRFGKESTASAMAGAPRARTASGGRPAHAGGGKPPWAGMGMRRYRQSQSA